MYQRESIVVIVILVIIIIYFMYREFRYEDLIVVKAPGFDKKFKVRKDKSEKAATILGKLANILDNFVEKLCKDYPEEPRLKRLQQKFDSSKLMEKSKLDTKNTSYTINKGEKLVLCLRNKINSKKMMHMEDISDYLTQSKKQSTEKERFIDFNVMLFVAIHELSHIMSKTVGHNKEFWTNFRYLLQKAIDYKIYTPIDFKESPVKYCGMDITSSPLDM